MTTWPAPHRLWEAGKDCRGWQPSALFPPPKLAEYALHSKTAPLTSSWPILVRMASCISPGSARVTVPRPTTTKLLHSLPFPVV